MEVESTGGSWVRENREIDEKSDSVTLILLLGSVVRIVAGCGVFHAGLDDEGSHSPAVPDVTAATIVG